MCRVIVEETLWSPHVYTFAHAHLNSYTYTYTQRHGTKLTKYRGKKTTVSSSLHFSADHPSTVSPTLLAHGTMGCQPSVHGILRHGPWRYCHTAISSCPTNPETDWNLGCEYNIWGSMCTLSWWQSLSEPSTLLRKHAWDIETSLPLPRKLIYFLLLVFLEKNQMKRALKVMKYLLNKEQ